MAGYTVNQKKKGVGKPLKKVLVLLGQPTFGT